MQNVELVDGEARKRAVDPQLSCIVRAPAGSGKTELLIQRYLALLGRVERPDEILAITFTRKAAAEMVQRVLSALADGRQPLNDIAAEHERVTHALAQAVLIRDREREWHLLEHPDQLQIKTIDSFNAALVRSMPWLTRLGGLPKVSEYPQTLYRRAIDQMIHLHHRQPELNEAVKCLLLHLDNRVDVLQQMLIKLLARRDQWLRHLLSDAGQQRDDLELALAQLVNSYLGQLSASVPPPLQQELLELGAFAAQHCATADRPLIKLSQFAQAGQGFPRGCIEDLDLWRGLADLLLTADGHWRKRCDKNCGFPAGKAEPFAGMKKRMGELLALLRDSDVDSTVWQLVRKLPDPCYSANQWQVLQALLTVLPQTVAQLWLEFSASGEVDFVEIALRARQALVDSGNPTEQLLALDRKLHHILIDEFQDTSWLQYELLQTVISGWDNGDGRSLFIVGDPMQSIYRFREAEVGLFLRAGKNGIGAIDLQSLQLRANFRSQQGIVDWVNASFSEVFPVKEDAGSGAVSYAMAQAVIPCQQLFSGDAVQFFPQIEYNSQVEAEQVCSLVQKLRQSCPAQTIAILVRSRSHLVDVLEQLRSSGISYQAHNVDQLTQRAAVSDVIALVRALLHPADNLSWLGVLRAPWCGLLLTDLLLFGSEAGATVMQMMQDNSYIEQLSDDGRMRVVAITPVLQAAIARRGSCSLRQLVEETWLQLLGPQCYEERDCQDVEQVLALLEKLDRGGDLYSFEELDEELGNLFSAVENDADGQVQVMTIHKAKGLEFDHVILPALGRRPRGEDKSLLRWQEHAEHGLLLAPIAARGGFVDDPIYELLGEIDKTKGEYEVARLLYVAVTRAKNNLYMFGHAALNKNGEFHAQKGSLLAKLWPAVKQHFSSSAVDDSSEVIGPANVELSPVLRRLTSENFKFVGFDFTQGQLSGAAAGSNPPFSVRMPAVIGTTTHKWLEYIAQHQDVCWDADRVSELCPKIKAQLAVAGVDEGEQQQYCNSIISMLQRTVASSRGRWILNHHQQTRCEYPLSGVDERRIRAREEIKNLVIDRTFVFEEERWIIDYKTSAPSKNQSVDDFYCQQGERYRSQLEGYVTFMRYVDPKHPCRCALYFPAFDGWYEVEVD